MLLEPFDPALAEDAAALDFRDTAFFKVPPGSEITPQLPSPAEVLKKAGPRAKNAVFEGLRLFVKFGGYHSVRREGVQAMQAIHRTFCSREIPVPEVYGWRAEDDRFFIYMEWMPGVRLRNVFSTLTTSEMEQITECCKLLDTAEIFSSKRLRQKEHHVGEAAQSAHYVDAGINI
jgi:hypothetical protein